MSPKVVIVILNWNGWGDTFECLKSLASVTYDNFEIILIDNASKEKTRFSNETFPSLKLTQIFNECNLGFAAGNNFGIKSALKNGADYVLLLNNDTIVDPDFLIKLADAAQKNPTAGVLGPMIYFHSHQLIWSAGGRVTHHFTRGELIGYKEIDRGQYAQGEVDYLSGTCLLVSRGAIAKAGLLSEDYFLYYEDTDWCLKIKKAGYCCLFVSDSIIYHKASRSAGEFSYPYIYYHTRNGLIFAARFGSKIFTLLFSVWIFLKQLLKLFIGYKPEWARPVKKGVIDFWRGKKGKLSGYY